MRDFKGMKRQRGRNRSSGGGKPSGGGGGGNNANRAFDSNGPDGVKVRGHAQHIYEKYQQLSRDAASAGDRVLLENYLQHAEHYYRLIRTLQPQRAPAEIMGRDSFTNGYDIDFEDESGEPLEQAPEPEQAQDGSVEGLDPRGDGRRDEFRRDRDGRDNRDFSRPDGQREFRGDRDRDRDRGELRQDRPSGERNSGERPSGDRPVGDRPLGDRPGGDRSGGDRPGGDRAGGDRPGERQDRPFAGENRGEGRGERRRDRDFDRRPERAEGGEPRGESRESRGEYGRDARRERDAAAGVDAVEAPPAEVSDGASGDDGQMLRDRSGGFSPAPAFLQAAPLAEEEERRPRRRRRTRDEIDRDAAAAAAGEPDAAPPVGADEA